MDKAIAMEEGQEKTTWEKREEFEDGSSKEVRVEKVSNGFIQTISTRKKEGDDWKYSDVKSIHQDNPMEEKSVVDKLAEFLNK